MVKNISDMTERNFRQIPHAPKSSEQIHFQSLVILPAKIEPWYWVLLKIVKFFSRMFPLFCQNLEDWQIIKRLHDSGYRCMSFITINKDNAPEYQISYCSDVIHVEGIGGFGYNWLERGQLAMRMMSKSFPEGWMIDCLPRSGLLRLFPMNRTMVCDNINLSSFEVWSEPNED